VFRLIVLGSSIIWARACDQKSTVIGEIGVMDDSGMEGMFCSQQLSPLATGG
jgi:hypothetical protein